MDHRDTLTSLSPSQLKNGNLQYISDAGVGGKVERTLGDLPVADGQWHTFLLQKNGTATSLRADDSQPKEILHHTQDFGGMDVLTLSLGGVPPGHTHQKSTTGRWTVCS